MSERRVERYARPRLLRELLARQIFRSSVFPPTRGSFEAAEKARGDAITGGGGQSSITGDSITVARRRRRWWRRLWLTRAKSGAGPGTGARQSEKSEKSIRRRGERERERADGRVTGPRERRSRAAISSRPSCGGLSRYRVRQGRAEGARESWVGPSPRF
jgi:hypothetical protein